MASGRGGDDPEGGSWRLVGPAAGLSGRRCRLLHSSLGRGSDVCLFHAKGEFYALDARCAHSGNDSIDCQRSTNHPPVRHITR